MSVLRYVEVPLCVCFMFSEMNFRICGLRRRTKGCVLQTSGPENIEKCITMIRGIWDQPLLSYSSGLRVRVPGARAPIPLESGTAPNPSLGESLQLPVIATPHTRLSLG